MRLVFLSVFVLVAAVGLAWLVPTGSDGTSDRGRSDAAAHGSERSGPLLVGRQEASSAGRPRVQAPGVAAPLPAAAPDRAPVGRPGFGLGSHRVGVATPVAPGRATSDPTLGDTSLVPIVTRRAFLEVADPANRGTAPHEKPWWTERRGWFGGTDSTVVSLVRDEAEAASREEELDPLVTAVVGTVVNDLEEPIAGADIVVYSAFYERHLNYGHRIREVGRVSTDAEGRFDLRPISLDTVHFGSNGEVVLSVSADGFGDIVTRRLANIEPEIENELGRFVLSAATCTLQGRLIDRLGVPVAGATVRVSGSLEPVLYDKRERMVFLRNCPTATTDDDGRYELAGFAPDQHFVSIHVNIDSPWTEARQLRAGENQLDLTIRAGGSVRGVVVDELGEPLAAAIVAGGENYTHTLDDGSFWLDNVASGPFPVWVLHHQYRSVVIQNVGAQTEDLHIELTQRLPLLRLRVVSGLEAAVVPVVAVRWTWPKGQPPNPAVPASPYWNDPTGTYAIPIPERAQRAVVSAANFAPQEIDVTVDQDAVHDVHLRAPPPVEEPIEDATEAPSNG